nr:hypothetical protein [Armatimonas sp.]
MRRLRLVFLLTLILLGGAQPGRAVVQWARQYNLPCSGCHAGFPRLNDTGIRFRQLGYRFDANEEPKLALENLVGPTWAPGLTVNSDDTTTLQRRGVKIHLGGALTSNIGLLVQPTPGEKNNFNMAQMLITQGAFRLTAGRLYAWENGGGAGAADRFPTSSLPRMFASLGGIAIGDLGTGFRLDHSDTNFNQLSLFSTDLSGGGARTPTQGLALSRRLRPKGLNYAEIFAATTKLTTGGSAQRLGATISNSQETKDGELHWLLLGGALFGSRASKRLGAGFVEVDWFPLPRNIVLLRTELEQGVTTSGTRLGVTLGTATQFSPQERLDLDWTPKRINATTAPFTAKLRFFF